jgi:hypothetical protein
MATIRSPIVTTDSSYKTVFSQNEDKQPIEYNIILYNKCNQIIILQYIHSIISIILVFVLIYIFYQFLKKNN